MKLVLENGIELNFKTDIKTISVEKDDIVYVNIKGNMNAERYAQALAELKEIFPNNTVMLADGDLEIQIIKTGDI